MTEFDALITHRHQVYRLTLREEPNGFGSGTIWNATDWRTTPSKSATCIGATIQQAIAEWLKYHTV